MSKPLRYSRSRSRIAAPGMAPSRAIQRDTQQTACRLVRSPLPGLLSGRGVCFCCCVPRPMTDADAARSNHSFEISVMSKQ